MARYKQRFLPLAALIGVLLACNPAYADRPIARRPAPQALAGAHVQSPYHIELMDENGMPLKTYQRRSRFYVLGDAGERYSIRVTNPTAHRVEAVISVDGLDVIDGQPADLRKRGYVIPAYSDVRIDGFRVSTQNVATFRFSSVAQSYAGRKGRARNVGVIGVAIFEESLPPELALPAPHHPMDQAGTTPPAPPAPIDRYDEAEAHEERDDYYRGDRPSTRDSAARPSRPEPKRSAASGAAAKSEVSADEAMPGTAMGGGRQCCSEVQSRPGLGTEFGEQRYSAVSWTQFIRKQAARPSVLTELRYNDAAGLRALGIQVDPYYDESELTTRETADPFPQSRFAEPPR